MDIRALLADQIERSGDAAALYHDEVVRDWRWMAQVHREIAERLVEAGLNRAPAALIARNRPLAVAALAAQVAAGRATAMIYGTLPDRAIMAEILSTDLPVVIAEAGPWHGPCAESLSEAGIHVLLLEQTRDGPVARMVRPRIARTMRTIDPDVGFEILSSGTTGAAKRIALRWDTMSSAVADAGAAYTGSATLSAQIMLHPLGNVAGVAYVLPALARRQPLVLLEKFRVRSWLDAVERHRPLRVALPPAALKMLMDAETATRDALSSVMVVGVGGGALAASLQAEFEERFDVCVLPAYGATEFGGVIANWALEDYRIWGKAKRGSVGRASRNTDLRVVAPGGAPLAPGQTGLLEARVARLGESWIRTTDLARIDEDGFLFIEGRADGAINRGGFKIMPEKVMRAMEAHPDVEEAVVVAKPDERLGSVPVAVAVAAPGRSIDEDALMDYLRGKLLPYEVPVEIRILGELPRTDGMKVRLNEIAMLFATGRRSDAVR